MQAEPAASLPANTLEVVLAVAMAALVAAALALLAGSITRRLLRAIEGERFQTQSIADTTVGVVRSITFVASVLILIFPALDFAGVDLSVGLRGEDLARWTARTGVRLALLLLLAYAASRFASSVIRRAEREIVTSADAKGLERRKRARTLGSSFERFLSILIWSTAVLVILRELDVDITPVLTGAGIVGLAIGFGAQTLVKDIIAGMFLIAEDQIRIGDVAEVNGIGGAIEEINLRTVVLRDQEGVVHTIANGEIRTLANRSKDFAFYVIDIGVGYDDDTDRIVDVVKDTAAGLMLEPAFAANILEPLEVIGVDAFKATEVTLRFRIKTLPLKQWEVGRELRRRIRRSFESHGIRTPVPRMEVSIRNADEQ
jgi:small conductance mechanosensitive channel